MKLGFSEYQKHKKNKQYKKYVSYLRINRSFQLVSVTLSLKELACSNYNNVQIAIKDFSQYINEYV